MCIRDRLNRASLNSIFNCDYKYESILEAIKQVNKYKKIDNSSEIRYFGEGQSDKLFFDLLQSNKLWSVSHQKQFREIL
jgi:UDP-N-acetylglucosamine 2-epimerase (hydrolysing)